MKDRFSILLFIFAPFQILFAQNIDTLINREYLETIIEETTDENSNIFLKDQLESMLENPINLNTCTIDDLLGIPNMSPLLAKTIIGYRERHSYFDSLHELRNIFPDDDLYHTILPFITVKKIESPYKIKYTTSLLNTLEKSRGYSNIYQGSNLRLINKIQSEYKPLNMIGGFLIEKDPGEVNINDFYTGYLSYEAPDLKLFLGDYLLELGQGLCFGKSFTFSKGVNTIYPVMKHFRGIKTYLSCDENQFLRGLALQSKFDNLNILLFYSNHNIDGNIDSNYNVSSLIYSGLHRTDLEQSKKHTVKEILYGGRAGFTNPGVNIGINYYSQNFDKDLELSQFYSFKGKHSQFFSLDYEFTISNVLLFGEIARSIGSSYAMFAGSVLSISENLYISLTYRKYPENFTNLHSFGFGENGGNTQNEEGAYLGISFSPLWFISLTAYYDIFHFPYRTFYNPLPTYGKDGLISCEIKYLKSHRLFFKYNNESKEESLKSKDSYNRDNIIISKRNKYNIRLDLISELDPNLHLKGRVELCRINYIDQNRSEKGLLIFQDLTYHPIDNLFISCRMVFFDSDSYFSRIYEYESEINGVYNNIELFNRGKRFYIMLTYQFNRLLNLSLKYSNTFYDNAKTIGTGYDLIQGNVLNKMSMQLILNL